MAENEHLLELAAESGCYMLSIGFESISPAALRRSHKYQNKPERYAALVRKIQRHGILVFGLFMFGFDEDEEGVFEETAKFTIDAGFDVCAYSVVTPYPGTVDWFRMQKAGQIVNYDWNKYDQGHIVYEPKNLTREQLREGHLHAYRRFYAPRSLLKRFPYRGGRSRSHWAIYNAFFRRGEVTGRSITEAVAPATDPPGHVPVPPILPERRDWQQIVADGQLEQGCCDQTPVTCGLTVTAPAPRPAVANASVNG